MALKDDSFYEPLFKLIVVKLRETGRTDLEIFIGELLPIVDAFFDGEDIYEAIILLVATGIIQRDESDGNTFIEFVEC